jgi:hypothetical protein
MAGPRLKEGSPALHTARPALRSDPVLRNAWRRAGDQEPDFENAPGWIYLAVGGEDQEAVKRGWVVELEGRVIKAEVDIVEKIGEELADLHAVASINRQGLLATTATVMANTYLEALDHLYEALAGTVGRLDVERAEAMTEERQDRDLEVSNAPDLVGIAEIAELANTSRQRVFQMTANKGFPAALLELRSGRLWSKPAIESYLANRRAVIEAAHHRAKSRALRPAAVRRSTTPQAHA